MGLGWGERGVKTVIGLVTACIIGGCGDSATRPVLTSNVPRDVTPTEDPSQADMDDYSWRMFVALNWPSVNGAPSSDPIGTRPGELRVWETYTDATTILTELKAGLSVRVPETPQGRALNTDFIVQAGSDLALIDAERNFIVNEFIVNDIFVNYSVANGLVSTDGFERYAASHGALVLPDGSISVKASWRILTDADAELAGRYHVRNATISVSASDSASGEAFVIEGAKVGLVALHIVQKTPSKPDWIWSTFEHVDLIDGSDPILDVGTEGSLASNRPPEIAATGEPTKEFFWLNPSTGQPTAANYIPPLVARSPNELPYPDTTNARYQSLLLPPWSNYRLVTTQWRDTSGSPRPTNSSGVSIAKNTALETYLLGDQSISLQVPGRDTTNACPQPDDGSTLWAEIEQIELYFGYPETGAVTTTWSSCFMCHQLSLYKYGSADEDVIATDYSFVYKSLLPEVACD